MNDANERPTPRTDEISKLTGTSAELLCIALKRSREIESDLIQMKALAISVDDERLKLEQELARLRDEVETVKFIIKQVSNQLAQKTKEIEGYKEMIASNLETVNRLKQEHRKFLKNISDNYDCDTGAHGIHSPHCRSCEAKALLGLPNENSDQA